MEEADALLVNPPDTPGAPETPAAEEPAAETSSQPRDEQGRFTTAPKAEEPEASPEAPAPAPETPEPTATPEPAPVEYPPFSYRADGQEFSFPGSAVGDKGITFKSEHIPELQQLLSAGKAAMGSVRQRLSDAAQREQAAVSRAEAAEAQAGQVLAHFEELIEKSQGQELAQSPMGQWLMDAAMNWPILKARAEAKAVELKNKAAADRLAEYERREEESRMRPLMDQALDGYIQQFGKQAGLSDQGIKEVADALKADNWRGHVFVKADYDDPARGVRQGQLAVDLNIVQDWVQRAAKWGAGRQAQPQPQAPKAPPKPAPKIPPTVGAKGARVPTPAAKIPKFNSAKEADAWFERGGYNEIDLD